MFYFTFHKIISQSEADEQWARAMKYVNEVPELNYMTQIVIMMYEDPTKVYHFSFQLLEIQTLTHFIWRKAVLLLQFKIYSNNSTSV